MEDNRHDRILVGRISGLFGVKGWIKAFSYTEPRANIVRYSPWHLLCAGGERVIEVASGRCHGEAVVAKLQDVDDRDAAALLVGADIEVGYQQLERLPIGEYYWAQLLGLEVIDVQGRALGVVDHLLRTGANDVLVVEGDRQRLIPFVQGAIVKDIDLAAGVMRVDWAPDY
jgi:16S rRNA processing protein RimM